MSLNSLPVSPLPVIFKGTDGLHSLPLPSEAVEDPNSRDLKQLSYVYIASAAN